MVSVQNVKYPLCTVNFRADNRQTRPNDPPMLVRQQQRQQQVDSYEKEKKKQKLKNNVITGISLASAIAIIAMAVMSMKNMKATTKLAEEALQKGEPTAAQRELGFKTTEEIKKMFEDVSNAESFEDLEMSGKLKEELELIIDKIKNAKTYEEYCQEINNAILFYGPPGTGKTAFVLALCKKLGIKPFIYDMGKLKGGFQGVTEANMNKASEVFLAEHRAARAKDPNHIDIMFFDECDEIFRKPKGGNENSDSQILQRFKKSFNVWKDEEGVYIFGNTNCMPEELEAAMQNRWDAKYIPNPTKNALSKNFFKHYSKGSDSRIGKSLKEPSEASDKFFEIMANHESSYRDLKKNCWTNIKRPADDRALEFKDIVDYFLSIKEQLHLTDSEVKTLQNLFK